jgi:hypothetical protein
MFDKKKYFGFPLIFQVLEIFNFLSKNVGAILDIMLNPKKCRCNTRYYVNKNKLEEKKKHLPITEQHSLPPPYHPLPQPPPFLFLSICLSRAGEYLPSFWTHSTYLPRASSTREADQAKQRRGKPSFRVQQSYQR